MCVAVMVMAMLLVAGVAGADVAALKTSPGLTFQVGDGTVDTITDATFQPPNPVTVVTTNVADAHFYNVGNSQWKNQGGSTQFGGGGANDGQYGKWALYKFDLTALPGFAGGTVNKAEFRLHASAGGSLTIGELGPIVSSDWDEGNKYGVYGEYPGLDLTGTGGPPPAPGVSRAHPSGINTSSYQGPGGAGTSPNQTWGDGNDFFNIDPWTGTPGGVAPLDGVHPGDGDSSKKSPSGVQIRPSGNSYEGWLRYEVTAIVGEWADGTLPNYGFYMERSIRPLDTSESGWDTEPVLFIDYEPAAGNIPEPAGLGLLGLALLGFRRKRS
jgi:MYXO-CTERM domain-containing protein